MKKTQLIALFMYIKKTFVSFISIIVFVALGIAIFLGIKWDEPALSATLNVYLNEHSFHDLMLVFPYGFTKDDVAAAESLDEVETAEGAYSAYGTSYMNDEIYTIVAQSLTEKIDVSTVIEGELPSAPNEVGIEKMFSDTVGVKIGDTITFNESGKNYLNSSEFLVTAIVEHPSYFRTGNVITRGICDIGDGSVDFFMIVPSDAFNTESFSDCYSQLLIRGTGLETMDTLSDDYSTAADEMSERIKALGIERATLRCDTITEDANSKIADGEKKIADAEAEIAKAKEEIADGEKKIADAKAEITDGEQKIADAEAEIADGKLKIEENKKKITDAQAEIADGEKKITDAEIELLTKKLEFMEGTQKIAEAKVKLADGEKQITDGEKELAEKKLEFEDGLQKISEAEAEIADGEQKIADAEKELAEKKLEIADGKKKIDEAKAKIEDAEKTIADNERLLNDNWAEYNSKYQEYLNGLNELNAGGTTLRNQLVANGYPSDFDEAEAKLTKDRAIYSNLLPMLNEADSLLQSIKNILQNNNENSINHTKVVSLLRSVFTNTDEILADYIKDASALSSNTTTLIGNILTRFGLSDDIYGAKMLRAIISEINSYLDKYENSTIPEIVDDILQMLNLMRNYDISTTEPNLRLMNSIVNILSDAVSITTQRVENGISDIDKALTGISDYRSGAAKLESAKPALDDALAKLEAADTKLADAKTELENGKTELNEKISELTDGEAKLKDGESQLNEKKTELADGKKTLAENKILLADAKIQIENAEQDLADAKTELANGKAELNEKISELNDGEAKLKDGENQITKKKAELADAKTTVAENIVLLSDAEAKITDGERNLDDKKSELADAKQTVAEKEALLADSKAELSDGEHELNLKKAELADAKNELASFVRHKSWTVQQRSDNISFRYADFYAKSDRTLCFSMALLFVFVGIMVCYTSVTRNVNEAQTTTGVQKALGFRPREIIMHYMLYSVTAVIIGVTLGCLMGYFIIEPIVNDAFMPLFSIGALQSVYTVPEALIISLVELVLICIATYLPCRKLLKRPAVSLLRGDTPGCGKTRFYEKTKLWNKLSLYSQTTISNLANDGTRVTATLVGVAGCTALIVMSMALQFGVSSTPVIHNKEVWTYDSCLVFDNSFNGAQEEMGAVLDDFGAEYTAALRENIFIENSDGTLDKADLIVPENPEQFDNFIKLKDYESKQHLDIPENGAIISRTYQRTHKADIGDTIKLMNTGGVYFDCLIVGVSEHYLSSNQIVMSNAYYSAIMSKSAINNTIYINYADGTDISALTDALKTKDGYFSLTDENAKWAISFSAASRTTMLVVYIGLALSAAMALLVLLNLNIVCVNKKAKELIIMRINGFSTGAAKKYIYRDNIVLTAIGMVIGLFVGMGIGISILNAIQSSADNFNTTPSIIACLIAVGLTVLFTLITNLIALHKIDKMKVSDLNEL